jgi:Heme exporter protein D (CcmD)
MTHWQFVALSYALLVVLLVLDLLLPYLALKRHKRHLQARLTRERAQAKKSKSDSEFEAESDLENGASS